MNIKATGNISHKNLLAVDGKNVFLNIDTIQLLKLSEADFFYSAKINIKKRITQVVVKEENINRLSELIGIPLSKIQKNNNGIANRIVYKNRTPLATAELWTAERTLKLRYNELKKIAETNSEKLQYKVIDEAGAEKLKSKNVKIAYFIKEDGKINIAFLPKDSNIVNQTLSSVINKSENESENEKIKNLRLNNEIKKQAALSGEKPLYRVIDSFELNKLKEADIKFAVFENKDKFNIVFLKENEEKVKAILNDSIKRSNSLYTK